MGLFFGEEGGGFFGELDFFVEFGGEFGFVSELGFFDFLEVVKVFNYFFDFVGGFGIVDTLEDG